MPSENLHGKDCCHGWFMLAASFVCLSICIGLPLSFGVLLPALCTQFGKHQEKAEVAVTGAIAYSCLNLISPVSSLLMRLYGCRVVVISGGLLAGLGFSLCFLAQNVIHMYLCYGVMGGVGFGLIFAPCLSNLPIYFEKYKYFAVSFATVGSAAGTLIMPQVLYFLVETYTWRGAILLCGGLALQAVVCGALMQNKQKNLVADGPSNSTIGNFGEKSFLRDVRLYLLCLDSAFFGGCSYTIFSFTGSHAASKGLSAYQATWLISTIGISNIFSRIFSSFLSQIESLDRPLFFSFLTIAASICSFFMLICSTFTQFIACFLLYGLAYGGRISQMSSMLIDTFGSKRLAAAIGFYLFAGGVGALIVPIVSGKLNDIFDSSAAILWASLINLLGAILCFTVSILNRKIIHVEEC